MSVLTPPIANPFEPPPYPVWRFSVDEFHRLIDNGAFGEQGRVELLEGWLVPKMTHNPLHDGTIQIVSECLRRSLPAGWVIRIQSAVTMSDSEPEPDVTVVRGNERTYLRQHPGPADIGLIVEIADSSLDQDQRQKSRIYARARVPAYWIVNLVNRQVEVFTNPTGTVDAAAYAIQQTYRNQERIPWQVAGQLVAEIQANDLLPE